MFPLSLPLAVALLTSPADVSIVGNDIGVPLEALQAAAVALELMDARESKWTFSSEQGNSVATDLAAIRQRYAELHDAPPSWDAARFPIREVCNEACSMNRRYREWLVQRQELFSSEEWITEAIGECDQLWTTWDTVRDSRAENYYVVARRRALKTLRERIGPAAYYGGFLPAPLPVWRMRRTD